MAALAPIPRARVRAASRVKPGVRKRRRTAYRRSWRSVVILSPTRSISQGFRVSGFQPLEHLGEIRRRRVLEAHRTVFAGMAEAQDAGVEHGPGRGQDRIPLSA